MEGPFLKKTVSAQSGRYSNCQGTCDATAEMQTQCHQLPHQCLHTKCANVTRGMGEVANQVTLWYYEEFYPQTYERK